MNQTNILRSREFRKFWVPCLIFAGITVWLTVRQSYPLGLGINPDTFQYIHSARLLQLGGISALGDDFGVIQPLGYPLVLVGAARISGQDLLAISAVVNGMALLIIVIMFMLDARRIPGISPWLSGMLITFSLPLIYVSSIAMTETLFILVVYMVLRRAVVPHQGYRSAALLGVMTGGAFMVRYLGLTVIPVVFLQLVLFASPDFRQRLRISLVYLVVSFAIIGANLGRNMLVSGTMFGPRFPPMSGLATHLANTNEAVAGWFIPEIPYGGVVFWGLVALLLVFLWMIRRSTVARFFEVSRTFAIYPAFALVYLAALNAAATRAAFNGLDSRLVSPIYPALAAIILFVLASGYQTRLELKLSRVARCFLVLLLIAQPVRIILKDTHRRGRDGGGGYNQPMWRESSMLRECLPSLGVTGDEVFSNGADVLYLLARTEAVFTPGKGHHQSNLSSGVTRKNLFEKYPGLDGALIIWFDNITRPYLFTLDELAEMCILEQVLACDDGTVYRVTRPVMNPATGQ